MPALLRHLFILGFGLVDESVHSLVKPLLTARLAIAPQVQRTVRLIAETLEGFCQIAYPNILAAFRLLHSLVERHTTSIGVWR